MFWGTAGCPCSLLTSWHWALQLHTKIPPFAIISISSICLPLSHYVVFARSHCGCIAGAGGVIDCWRLGDRIVNYYLREQRPGESSALPLRALKQPWLLHLPYSNASRYVLSGVKPLAVIEKEELQKYGVKVQCNIVQMKNNYLVFQFGITKYL